MKIDQIAMLTKDLDGIIPKEGAQIKVVIDRHTDFNQVLGTPSGFLRLGVEFLRAGLALQEKGSVPFFANSELSYLQCKDTDVFFSVFNTFENSKQNR